MSRMKFTVTVLITFVTAMGFTSAFGQSHPLPRFEDDSDPQSITGDEEQIKPAETPHDLLDPGRFPIAFAAVAIDVSRYPTYQHRAPSSVTQRFDNTLMYISNLGSFFQVLNAQSKLDRLPPKLPEYFWVEKYGPPNLDSELKTLNVFYRTLRARRIAAEIEVALSRTPLEKGLIEDRIEIERGLFDDFAQALAHQHELLGAMWRNYSLYGEWDLILPEPAAVAAGISIDPYFKSETPEVPEFGKQWIIKFLLTRSKKFSELTHALGRWTEEYVLEGKLTEQLYHRAIVLRDAYAQELFEQLVFNQTFFSLERNINEYVTLGKESSTGTSVNNDITRNGLNKSLKLLAESQQFVFSSLVAPAFFKPRSQLEEQIFDLMNLVRMSPHYMQGLVSGRRLSSSETRIIMERIIYTTYLFVMIGVANRIQFFHEPPNIISMTNWTQKLTDTIQHFFHPRDGALDRDAVQMHIENGRRGGHRNFLVASFFLWVQEKGSNWIAYLLDDRSLNLRIRTNLMDQSLRCYDIFADP